MSRRSVDARDAGSLVTQTVSLRRKLTACVSHYPMHDELEIRLLTEGDIGAGMRLKELAGWNQTESDWRRLLKLDRQGCFAACIDHRVVGTATSTAYGPDLAWIGMVLVDPDYRRRGIATQLMQATLDSLRSRGVKT